MGQMRLTGMDGLRKVLRKLPTKVQERAVGNALGAGGRVIRKEAQQRAPVWRGKFAAKQSGRKIRYPGFLRRNIVVRRNKKKESGKTVVYQVGPSRAAFYGALIEFGTKHIGAQPWLRPAFEASKGEAFKKTGTQMGKAVEREALKLAGQHKTKKLRRRTRRK